MFLAEIAPDIVTPDNAVIQLNALMLGIGALVIAIVQKAIKPIPYVEARADWLLPPIVVVSCFVLGMLAQIGDASPWHTDVLSALALGATTIGTFKSGQWVGKIRNGKTPV